jgi:hypothetical protein
VKLLVKEIEIMVRKKSVITVFFSYSLKFIMAILAIFLVYRFVDSTIDQHSGPFTYFKDAEGKGSVLERGKEQVELWLKAGNNGEIALKNGRKAGFKCKSLEADYSIYNDYLNTKSGGCHYVFGFFGENWYFGVTTDDKGVILRSFNDIAPPIGL